MAAIRMGGKSATAFRTISEVSQDLDVPQHVLRFWESKFSQVRPLKRAGGRRYYRPEDIELLRRIRELLYSEGYTIKGVQRLLREGTLKVSGAAADSGNGGLRPACRQEIEAILDELVELRDLLRATPRRVGGDRPG
jgi:DNA-binding transcriptional MerR regulator